MAREMTYPGSGRLKPTSYKTLPSVKVFMSRYAGKYTANASDGARTAIRQLCELSESARLLMGQVVADGEVPPPGVRYDIGDAAAFMPIEDLGVDEEAPTRYGVTMTGGSATLTPAEMEFLKRLGKSVGGGLRLVVQELVRLGDERACQILAEIGQEAFVPVRWAEYAAATLAV